MLKPEEIRSRARGILELPAGSFDVVVANAVEAEPLLGAQSALLEARPTALILGLRLAMLALGARRGVVATRSKPAARAVAAELRGASEVEIARAKDAYLADEAETLKTDLLGPGARAS